MKIPTSQFVVDDDHKFSSSESDQSQMLIKEGDYNDFNNDRLMTPGMRNISTIQDASYKLKGEIGMSTLRVKAAKFGRAIGDLAPQHPNKFYLPDKQKY